MYRQAGALFGLLLALPGCGDGGDSSNPAAGGTAPATGSVPGTGGDTPSGGGGGTGGTAGATGGTAGTVSLTTSRIAAGTDHACAVTAERGIECWGDFTEIGDPPRDTGWDRLWAAGGLNCGVKTDGSVECWGDEALTLSGTYSAVAPSNALFACAIRASDSTLECLAVEGEGPVPTGAPTDPVKHVACANDYCCAIRSADSSVICWGDTGTWGPSPVAGAFVSVDVENTSACALSQAGHLECWGPGLGCLLGVPTGQFVDVDVEDCEGCALGVDGNITCWGNLMSETPLPGPFIELATGEGFACGLRASGTIECWGSVGQVPSDLVVLVD